MKKLLPLVACLAIAAVVTTTAAKGAGGKPPAKPSANPNMTVAFTSSSGDGIVGDGNSYVGGSDGAMVVLQPSSTTPSYSGFTNLYLLLSNTSRAKRYYVLNYPPSAVVDNGCGLVGGPTATGVKVKGQIFIKSIGAMAIGEARAVRAHVKTLDNEFHWSEGAGNEHCSATLAAYRPSWNSWIVSTDVARLGLPNCDVPGIEPGSCATNGSGAVVGATLLGHRGLDDWGWNNGGPLWQAPSGIAQLGGFSGTFYGNYNMPFAITVMSTDTRLQNNFVTCSLGGNTLTSGCSIPY